ncbi:MAG: RIP metalloprotease RseP [Bacteroides sp.]
MAILIKALQLLASLSLLVILHEFGHYIAARIFGVRVEKFYLFFNPYFSLFKKKIGQTEWGIGWIPLGGYAKIAGMVDESLDHNAIKRPPEPYEFRSKAAWKRLIIILGGIIMNLITAWVIYSALIFSAGETYLPTRAVRYGIVADSLMQEIGFKTGDKLLYVNGKTYEDFNDFMAASVLTPDAIVTVERNDQPVDVPIPKIYLAELLNKAPIFQLRLPLILDYVAPNSAAAIAGLQAGDSLLALDKSPATYFDEFRSCILAHPSDTVEVEVMRNGERIVTHVIVPDSCIVGIRRRNDLSKDFTFATYRPGFFASFTAGGKKFCSTIQRYWNSLKLFAVPEAKAHKSVGGFISIGKIFPSTWDWYSFWSLTAFLSLVLAVMNLLPIPALDGGHAILILIELLTGKKLGTRTLITLQLIGMFLLFFLLIYANTNDIIRLFS